MRGRFSRTWAIALAGAALSGAAMTAGAWAVLRSEPRGYYETRRLVVLAHARQRAAPIVILGDSIVDMADAPELCGRAVLNAGVAGARTAEIEALARDVLATVKPQLVIVAVGLNDAHRRVRTGDEAFLASYRTLLARVRMAGAAVRATTIPPVGPPHLGRASEFDPARIVALNRLIRRSGVPVIDVHRALAGAGGATPPRFTDDGVHPNARGYGIWRKVVAQACAT